jgi:hypothetical protein
MLLLEAFLARVVVVVGKLVSTVTATRLQYLHLPVLTVARGPAVTELAEDDSIDDAQLVTYAKDLAISPPDLRYAL